MASGEGAATEERFRVIVIGSSKVGKTSLIQKYLFNEFSFEVPQTQTEEKKTVMVNNKPIKLLICDLAGENYSLYQVLLLSAV